MDIKSSWMHHKISDGDKALMRFGIDPTNTFEFDSIMRQQYILQPTKIYVILNCTPRAKMPMIRRQWRCLGITQMLFTCDASSVWHRFLQNANNAMRSTSPRNVRWRRRREKKYAHRWKQSGIVLRLASHTHIDSKRDLSIPFVCIWHICGWFWFFSTRYSNTSPVHAVERFPVK